MAKPSTTAADILSLKNVRPAVRRLMIEERWNLELAKSVYELRQRAGLSIRQLSQRARVPASTIQRLEDADPSRVSLAQLLRVVHAVGGKLTVSRHVPRWFALVHGGRILQETFAVDEADALRKFRELRGKLPMGAKVEKSTGKNQLDEYGKATDVTLTTGRLYQLLADPKFAKDYIVSIAGKGNEAMLRQAVEDLITALCILHQRAVTIEKATTVRAPRR